MSMEYKTQKELYLNLVPALNVKMKSLKRDNYKDITKEDIWNYLKDTKWKFSIDLTLSDMVNDIIKTDNIDIKNYKLKDKKELL